MRLGSMFSGVLGLDLAVERATGGVLVWTAESAVFPRSVIRHRRPAAKIYRDVRTMGLQKPLAPVDVLVAGFPCTDISVAGKGEGISGERSGLWSEVARVIDAVRPRRVMLENVAAIRSRGLDVVLADLHRLGYAAEWVTVTALAAGAQHLRARWFCMAYPDGADTAERLTDLGPDYQRAFVKNRGAGGVWEVPAECASMAPVILPGAMPAGRRRAMLLATGNGVVPQQAFPVAARLMADGAPFQGGDVFDVQSARAPESSWPSLPASGVMREGVLYARPDPVPLASAKMWHAADSRMLFATPCAANWRSGLVSDALAESNSRPLQEQAARLAGNVAGGLNPPWVSALMGWPPGWLNVGPEQLGLFGG